MPKVILRNRTYVLLNAGALSMAWGDFGDYTTDLFTAEAEKVIERHGKW